MRRIGGHSRGIESMVISPDGAFVVATDGEQVVRWDLAGGEPQVLCEGATRIAISADGTWLVVGDDAGTLSRITVADGESEELAEGSAEIEDGVGLQDIAISPRGERIALCGGDDRIEIRDATSGELLWDGTIVKYPYVVRWRGDGLVIGSWDGAIYCVDASGIADGTSEIEYYDPQYATQSGPIFDLAWVGERLAIAWAMQGRIALWDFATEDYAASVLVEHGMHALAVSPDGTRLVAGGNDQALHLYDARTLEDLGSFTLLPPSLEQPAEGGEIRGFHNASGPAAVRALVYHPDGTRVIAGLEDGGIVEVTHGELLARSGVIDVLALKRTLNKVDAEISRHRSIQEIVDDGASGAPGAALTAFAQLEEVAPDVAAELISDIEAQIAALLGDGSAPTKRPAQKRKRVVAKQAKRSAKKRPANAKLKTKTKAKPKAKAKAKPKAKAKKSPKRAMGANRGRTGTGLVAELGRTGTGLVAE